MNLLYTRDSVYGPIGRGTYRDDPSYRLETVGPWLNPVSTQDEYAGYGIEPDR